MCVIAVGGLDGRYPVLLRHFVEHPKAIGVDTSSPELPLALEIVGQDDTMTVVAATAGNSTEGVQR